MFQDLLTPNVLIDIDRMEKNLAGMQAACDANNVELRPHIKTHKMNEVARRQLAGGAKGLTVAKIGEAEALLPAFDKSTFKSVFVAHSIVDPNNAPRLKNLHDQLDELVLATTSAGHAEALEKVLDKAGLTLDVIMAADTGLHREGVRSVDEAKKTAQTIANLPHLKLRGFYTHEGHTYGVPPEESDAAVQQVHDDITAVRDAVQEYAHTDHLSVWPGSSVTAARMAALPDVDAVRPGSYVFGDLALAQRTKVMPWDNAALSVLATVVDRPEKGLALINAGSKVFSSDRTPDGVFACSRDGRDIKVMAVNEEHGYLRGNDVDDLKIGDRLRFIPAHTCTVVNLTDFVVMVKGDEVVDNWKVDARGKVR
jgi:D-serine deaminase-like pyridoxal phosphate-dependent protein